MNKNITNLKLNLFAKSLRDGKEIGFSGTDHYQFSQVQTPL